MANNSPMYPVITARSQGINPNNDSRHDKVEPTNRSGGPSTRTRKNVAINRRGGFGSNGQKRYAGSVGGTPQPTAGNPAQRGGSRSIGSMHPESRIGGHGGSPQRKGGASIDQRGGFGRPGKRGVVNDYPNANPKPRAGNRSGKMHKRIAGHFDNASKGPNAGMPAGKYGDPPVRLDT